jgi:hypothetical protein
VSEPPGFMPGRDEAVADAPGECIAAYHGASGLGTSLKLRRPWRLRHSPPKRGVESGWRDRWVGEDSHRFGCWAKNVQITFVALIAVLGVAPMRDPFCPPGQAWPPSLIV